MLCKYKIRLGIVDFFVFFCGGKVRNGGLDDFLKFFCEIFIDYFFRGVRLGMMLVFIYLRKFFYKMVVWGMGK